MSFNYLKNIWPQLGGGGCFHTIGTIFFFFFRAYTNLACHRPVTCATVLAFYLTPETRHVATTIDTNKETKAILLSFIIGV